MDAGEGPIRIFDACNGLKLKGYPVSPADLPEAARVSTWAWHARRVLGWDRFPDALVRYGTSTCNAFANPPFLVFGSGDGVVFGDFTRSMDVFVHEVAHHYIERRCNLMWMNQPGAVGEHLADVFAACVRRDVLRGSESVSGSSASAAVSSAPDWRLGSDLFLDGASCLRDMLRPGTAYDDPRIGRDPQVGHVGDVRRMREDRGGVHVNSGVPSRAFALFADAVGDVRALAVWEEAMALVPKDVSFARWRDLTVGAARGEAALVVAWAGVGL